MIKSQLSKDVIVFQKTGKGWDDIKSRISLFIYSWARNRKGIGSDLAAEFYLSFSPRITKVVGNYHEYECPFEHYLRICLEWHTMRFHSSLYDKQKKEEIYWETTGKYDALLASRQEEVYQGENRADRFFPSGPDRAKFRIKFLQFLLYNVDSVLPSMIERYAVFLNLECSELQGYLDKADDFIKQKKERREAIMQKKRSYYIDIKYDEMKLRITEEKEAREKLLDHLDRLHKRMEKLMDRADRIKMTPTTIEIARLTGCSPSAAGRNIKAVREYIQSLPEEIPDTYSPLP